MATHASTAASSRPEACLLLTLTYLRSPSCGHVCLHDGPSWPSIRAWQLGPFELMSCAWEVHGSHWDMLHGDVCWKHPVAKRMGRHLTWAKLRMVDVEWKQGTVKKYWCPQVIYTPEMCHVTMPHGIAPTLIME